MDKDVKLALCGNREVARRCTDRGVLVPCPGCGEVWPKYVSAGKPLSVGYYVCANCGWIGPDGKDEFEARLRWNIRAQIRED